MVRAQTFAATHFLFCQAHRSHAMAVHQALEDLAKRALLNLSPEDTFGDVLGGGIKPDAGDSLERLELQIALEEEHLEPSRVAQAFGAWSARHTMDALLGPARRLSKWDPETLWLRSIRGVINERVRYSDGCTCPTDRAPFGAQLERRE